MSDSVCKSHRLHLPRITVTASSRRDKPPSLTANLTAELIRTAQSPSSKAEFTSRAQPSSSTVEVNRPAQPSSSTRFNG